MHTRRRFVHWWRHRPCRTTSAANAFLPNPNRTRYFWSLPISFHSVSQSVGRLDGRSFRFVITVFVCCVSFAPELPSVGCVDIGNQKAPGHCGQYYQCIASESISFDHIDLIKHSKWNLSRCSVMMMAICLVHPTFQDILFAKQPKASWLSGNRHNCVILCVLHWNKLKCWNVILDSFSILQILTAKYSLPKIFNTKTANGTCRSCLGVFSQTRYGEKCVCVCIQQQQQHWHNKHANGLCPEIAMLLLYRIPLKCMAHHYYYHRE